jgi:histone H1/5
MMSQGHKNVQINYNKKLPKMGGGGSKQAPSPKTQLGITRGGAQQAAGAYNKTASQAKAQKPYKSAGIDQGLAAARGSLKTGAAQAKKAYSSSGGKAYSAGKASSVEGKPMAMTGKTATPAQTKKINKTMAAQQKAMGVIGQAAPMRRAAGDRGSLSKPAPTKRQAAPQRKLAAKKASGATRQTSGGASSYSARLAAAKQRAAARYKARSATGGRPAGAASKKALPKQAGMGQAAVARQATGGVGGLAAAGRKPKRI